LPWHWPPYSSSAGSQRASAIAECSGVERRTEQMPANLGAERVKEQDTAVCERAAMYPDGMHGRLVNSACQVHSHDAAPSPMTGGATDRTWDRLLGELSADADAAGELYWLVGVDSSISRGVTTQAPAQACPAHSPQDRTRLPPASTRSRELVQLCVKAA
jgi:hypothetical protein